MNQSMEREQRGPRRGCSGTFDNLLIDRMVNGDGRRRRRNQSMVWIDVKKAYELIDHKRLIELMSVHRFPE